MSPPGWVIRSLDPGSDAEIDLVATRMRATLIEVLGEAEGASMYSMEWLRDRVRFHLDPARSTAEVFLAVLPEGAIAAHTIVRVETDDAGRTFGLVSTTYVEPSSRRLGVAHALLDHGEAWFRAHHLTAAETYTSDSNTRLIALYQAHGYAITSTHPDKRMVVLSKRL
jgi:ribosomal protein S18 acetylase RimI-like enzyme